MGTSTYAPWYALLGRDTGEGLVIGWDYFGHWASSIQLSQDGTVRTQLKVAGHRQTLAPGESLATPKAFVGLFRDDLDEAGNEVLDWQYRYLWDYTREGWFPAIRMLGYWFKGTVWGQPGAGWTGGGADLQSTFRKVFRVADLMRYTGADVYHRDWGWWDRAGDVQKRLAENMGYPGIELTWKPATDNHWISYYEVFRDNLAIDKVAKGTYYFDHSAGADPAARYEVRTVDGSGNASPPVAAQGSAAKPSWVIDDTDAAIAYTGTWQRQTGLQPAHASTISSSDENLVRALAGIEPEQGRRLGSVHDRRGANPPAPERPRGVDAPQRDHRSL
jgi:hypothetical protein